MKAIRLFFSFAVLLILSSNSFSQSMPEVGTKAPDFTLQDASGNSYTLSDYIGKSPVVVYFYPAAGTSGCTKQACGIRDNYSKFEKNKIVVFGISIDSKEAIQKFINDYHLNFPLLSDTDKKVSRKYGVAKNGGGDKRVTFIIDMNGNVSQIINVTNIASHSELVFEAASTLLPQSN